MTEIDPKKATDSGGKRLGSTATSDAGGLTQAGPKEGAQGKSDESKARRMANIDHPSSTAAGKAEQGDSSGRVGEARLAGAGSASGGIVDRGKASNEEGSQAGGQTDLSKAPDTQDQVPEDKATRRQNEDQRKGAA